MDPAVLSALIVGVATIAATVIGIVFSTERRSRQAQRTSEAAHTQVSELAEVVSEMARAEERCQQQLRNYREQLDRALERIKQLEQQLDWALRRIQELEEKVDGGEK